MSFSLEASVRTCKVNDGNAPKIQSDRFQNPNLMMCPTWNGVDTTGRSVHPDTFVTKRAGCNSANDRITVENSLRPSYSEYITLNPAGIQGNNGPTMPFNSGVLRNGKLAPANDITGNFGLEWGSYTNPSCSNTPYVDAQRADAAAKRTVNLAKVQANGARNRKSSSSKRR